jgi:hypothetical protein
MALLWCDGFDEFGSTTVAGATILARKYTMANAGTANLVTGRFGTGYALQLGAGTWTNTLKKQSLAGSTDATFTVGIACKWSQFETEASFLSLIDGTTEAIQICMTMDGKLKLKTYYSSAWQTIATSTFILNANVWYYFEIQIVCTSATNFNYELRLGGTTVFSGSDTHKLGAHTYIDGFWIYGYNWKGTLTVDDVYATNGATGFLGNVRVETIYPSGDSGTVQWTPSANGTHYTLVDENPVDDNTTYVEDSTSGHIDLYDFANLSVLNSIKGAMVCVDCEDTSANSTLQVQCVSGATTVNSANLTVITSYTTVSNILETDPNTNSAWSVSNFNAAQFGVMVP